MWRGLVMAFCLLGCQISTGPEFPTTEQSVTAESALSSTFRVDVFVGGDHKGSGTGWIVRTQAHPLLQKPVSAVITAGHVCKETGAFYVLVDSKGRPHPAQRERMGTYNAEAKTFTPDLCLLMTTEILGEPLPISLKDPEYAEPVAYVGAPDSYWKAEEHGYFTGHYCGGRLVTSPIWPGSSGSAVFTEHGVVGVAIALDGDFHHLVNIATRTELVDFLK